jgi:hypothetical protein
MFEDDNDIQDKTPEEMQDVIAFVNAVEKYGIMAPIFKDVGSDYKNVYNIDIPSAFMFCIGTLHLNDYKDYIGEFCSVQWRNHETHGFVKLSDKHNEIIMLFKSVSNPMEGNTWYLDEYHSTPYGLDRIINDTFVELSSKENIRNKMIEGVKKHYPGMVSLFDPEDFAVKTKNELLH